MGGAAVLGALIGTVMSPCATPALAAALALAGSGALFGMSMLWGAALLLAYGLGHSVLLLVAGAMPSAASALARRFAPFQAWIPGRRAFALVMFAAGLWWIAQGLDLQLTLRPQIMNKLPKRRFHLVFSLLMGAMMIFVMTFVITMVNVGPVPDFVARWARAFLIAYVVGVPVIYFLAPTARKLTARFVEMP